MQAYAGQAKDRQLIELASKNSPIWTRLQLRPPICNSAARNASTGSKSQESVDQRKRNRRKNHTACRTMARQKIRVPKKIGNDTQEHELAPRNAIFDPLAASASIARQPRNRSSYPSTRRGSRIYQCVAQLRPCQSIPGSTLDLYSVVLPWMQGAAAAKVDAAIRAAVDKNKGFR
jgi:hypothetical protein